MGSIAAFFVSMWTGLSSAWVEIVVILAILGGVYLYWNHLENEVTTLTTENVQLQGVVNTQNTTINKLQTDFAKTQQDLDALNNNYSTITTNTNVEDKDFDIGQVTDLNKAQIETQANQNLNNIFTDIGNQTLPSSFVGATK